MIFWISFFFSFILLFCFCIKYLGGHNIDFLFDYLFYFPVISQSFSTFYHICLYIKWFLGLIQGSNDLVWFMDANSLYTFILFALNYGLYNKFLFTFKIRCELFPVFSILINQFFDFFIFLSSPSLFCLGKKSSISTVAHFFSSLRDVELNFFRWNFINLYKL